MSGLYLQLYSYVAVKVNYHTAQKFNGKKFTN